MHSIYITLKPIDTYVIKQCAHNLAFRCGNDVSFSPGFRDTQGLITKPIAHSSNNSHRQETCFLLVPYFLIVRKSPTRNVQNLSV